MCLCDLPDPDVLLITSEQATKNIGLPVLIDFTVFQTFSADKSAQKVTSLDPNLQEIQLR